MRKIEDQEIKDLAEVLQDCGSGRQAMGEGGLRFLCRQASRMIKDLRPDLAFDPTTTDQ